MNTPKTLENLEVGDEVIHSNGWHQRAVATVTAKRTYRGYSQLQIDSSDGWFEMSGRRWNSTGSLATIVVATEENKQALEQEILRNKQLLALRKLPVHKYICPEDLQTIVEIFDRAEAAEAAAITKRQAENEAQEAAS